MVVCPIEDMVCPMKTTAEKRGHMINAITMFHIYTMKQENMEKTTYLGDQP